MLNKRDIRKIINLYERNQEFFKIQTSKESCQLFLSFIEKLSISLLYYWKLLLKEIKFSKHFMDTKFLPKQFMSAWNANNFRLKLR